MNSKCAVSTSTRRAEIEAMLAAGESQRGVIRRMGEQGITLYRPSLAAHVRHMEEAA